jgi:hypothetical protein
LLVSRLAVFLLHLILLHLSFTIPAAPYDLRHH